MNKTGFSEHVNAQLTAPGDGATVAVGKRQPASAEYEVTVAVIDTTVVVRMEHSNDGFSTSVEGDVHTITANGSYVFPAAVGYKDMRPVFQAETGGTAATVDFTTRMSY